MKHLLLSSLLVLGLTTGIVNAQEEAKPEVRSESTEITLKGDENGMTVRVRDGKNPEDDVNIRVDLSGTEVGDIAQRVLQRLKEKGVIDEGDIDIINPERIENLENIEKIEMIKRLSELDKEMKISMGGDWATIHHNDDDDTPWFAFPLAIVAIIAVFGTPVLIVWMIIRGATRRKELVHENIGKLIEQGRDIPVELLQAYERQTSPEADLHRGIKTTLLGVAIIVAFTVLIDFSIASLGLIPVAIGLAQIITWKIQQGKQTKNQNSSNDLI